MPSASIHHKVEIERANLRKTLAGIDEHQIRKIYAMNLWEGDLVQLFVVALLLQDAFGFNLN